jgi:uncharacterized protein YlxW (UPF0749 family)
LFQKALPRILLAFILAFIISKPLEMRVFNKEIEAELPAMTAEKDRQNKARILRDQDASGQFKEENDEIAQMKEVVGEGDKKINDAKTKYENAEKTLIDEYNGRKQSSQPGIGHDYKIYEKQRDLAKNDYDSLIAPNNPDSFKAQLEAKRKRLGSLEESISIRKKALLDEANQKTELFDGLATRLTALSVVTESQRIVFLAGWLIFIMVFMLEIFPVLSKLFASYGPYERLVDEHEQKGSLRGEKEMLVLREEVSRLRESKEARTQALLDLQKKMLRDLNVTVSNLSQAEINDFRREFERHALSDLRSSINGNSVNQNNK